MPRSSLQQAGLQHQFAWLQSAAKMGGQENSLVVYDADTKCSPAGADSRSLGLDAIATAARLREAAARRPTSGTLLDIVDEATFRAANDLAQVSTLQHDRDTHLAVSKLVNTLSCHPIMFDHEPMRKRFKKTELDGKGLLGNRAHSF